MNVKDNAVKVIFILGRPASGKSTLLKQLKQRYELPDISKDDLKEIMFNSLGTGDVDWSVKLGRTSFSLIDYVVEKMLQMQHSFIIEANFNASYEDEKYKAWQKKYKFEAIQIHCIADKEILISRFIERASSPDRHAGHADRERVEDYIKSLDDNRKETLGITGQIIDYDTQDLTSLGLIYKELDSIIG